MDKITTTDLMAPRYKVIADWPGNKAPVGSIITYDNEFFKTVEGWRKWHDKYPAIYKEISWWEERKVDDMPEYIKEQNSKTGDFRVRKTEKWQIGIRYGLSFLYKYEGSEGYWTKFEHHYLPATLEEYNEYQKQATNIK